VRRDLTLRPSGAVVMLSGKRNFLKPSGPLRACNGSALYIYNLLRALLLPLNHSEGLRMLWMASHCSCSPDSALGMESEETFSIPSCGKRIFSSQKHPRTAVGRAPSRLQGIPGPLAPGVKRPGCRADCLPPSSAEIKNEWSHTSTPPNVFMTCTGIT